MVTSVEFRNEAVLMLTALPVPPLAQTVTICQTIIVMCVVTVGKHVRDEIRKPECWSINGSHKYIASNYLCYVLCNSKPILIAKAKVKQNFAITETTSACTQPDTSSHAEITPPSMLQCYTVIVNASDVTVHQFVPIFSN